ncbi:MAG: ABC transporter permease [Sphingobacteriales bacterium]
MIRNYIKTAWRNLVKNKVFSFINVFGLSVGLACCMFIIAYLYSELTYDTYPANYKQLYRVGVKTLANGGSTDFVSVDVAVGEGIKRTYPQVLAFTRILQQGPTFVSYRDKQFKEKKTALADSNFLHMFSIPLIQGDEKTALTEPNSIVINKELAEKYFGSEQPVGKMLKFGNGLMKVTGVIDKVPDNSHFHFDAFISMATISHNLQQTWSNVGFYTYLLLDKHADAKQLEAKLPQLVAKYVVPETQHDMGVSLAEAQKAVSTFVFYLLPITDIHLHTSTKYDLEPNSDISYVYIFGILAVSILLLACINFTNLSTASSARRSKEVGIRKVMGSLKEWLITQFLVESVMLTLFSMLLALAIVFLLLPYFNNLAGKHIGISFFLNFKALGIGIGLTLLVGILAGLYPAFFLSSFRIINVLKGSTGTEPAKKNFLQSSLVVFQFTVSTALIICTFVVYQQLHFMQNKKLGYDKDQLLVLNDTYTLGNNEFAFKDQLKRDSRVVNATVSTDIPGNGNMNGTEVYAKEHKSDETKNEIHTNIYRVDANYISTLGIKLIEGRNVSPDFPGDSSNVVINQSAQRELGWANTDPIGKTIVRSGRREYTVVGMVADFNYSSVKDKVAPLMMLANHRHGNIILKIKTADVTGLLSDIKKQWNNYHAGSPFSYYFVDEQFASLYSAEQRTGSIFTSFAVVAIIIAGLGLFGLAAFMIKQRVKEIGIRKVLGASSGRITTMLSFEFLKLVMIAIVISFPITWFAMYKWLQDFAYHIDIQWWVFIIAGVMALVIAFITVSFQSVKAAIANPVKSLRSE